LKKLALTLLKIKSALIFLLESNITPISGEISNKANALVCANLEIRSAFSDESAERRFWLIDGFSQVPCGGTHLRRNGEIGNIQLRRDNIGKGKERVVITLSE
jgi:Ser-tRNA(Ala) deacylase AlaX